MRRRQMADTRWKKVKDERDDEEKNRKDEREETMMNKMISQLYNDKTKEIIN